MIACFPNDTSAPETEQLTMPEKLGSGENWSDFDYPAEKVRCLWLTSPRRDTQTVAERIVELTGADVLH